MGDTCPNHNENSYLDPPIEIELSTKYVFGTLWRNMTKTTNSGERTTCFTHQQARTLLFARGAKKPLFPFLHLWCRGWVGGSPLSLEPTEVKHYARKARLPRFTHQQARTLLFARGAKKPLFPFLHLWCTPPPSYRSLHQLGLSVTKRDTTRTMGGEDWKL